MLLFTLFILGLAIGSFLNVLIDRLPQEKSINGRSKCDYCKKKLQSRDLVPVFSFLALRGRCRYCKKKLSFQYPFIELLTGTVFVTSWLYLTTSNPIVNVLYLGIIACLIAIFFADLKYQIIPDSLQLAFLGFTLGMLGIVGGLGSLGLISQRVFDGILVMSPILLLFLLSRGRAMGFGDVKLAFTMGLLLGRAGGFIALYIGFIIGGLVGAALLISGKTKMKNTIALGPFLVLGTVLVLFFRSELTTYFANLFRLLQ